MKIVYDNIIYSHVSQGGVSNYWFELSKFLMHKSMDEVFFYEERRAIKNFHRKQLEIPEDKLIIENPLINFSVKSRMSSVKINQMDNFLYHSSYYRPVSGATNYTEITTVHDFTHNYYSKFINKVVHNKIKYNAIRRSNGIICISENTYNDLMKFCPPTKKQKVQIIHNGVSDEYYAIDKASNFESQDFINHFNLDKPFILFVGSRANYKNFDFVVELVKEMKEFNLVIVGGELQSSELKFFDNETLQRTTVVSNIQNFELNWLYNYAHAFIYPSSYEGFGIPIIEAMKAGCPVLALNNSSITEIAGQAGILENQLNIKSVKNALIELKRIDFRNEIIGKGYLQASKFSWQKCCAETYDFYNELYKG